LTHTTTILSDHHGVAKRQVKGHEYYVDAAVDITEFRTDVAFTGTFVAAANTFTLTVANLTDFPSLKVGQSITISDTESATNDGTVTITAISGVGAIGSVLTLSAVAGDETGDAITVRPTYELLLASEFGLRVINTVFITGQETDGSTFGVKTTSGGLSGGQTYVELHAANGAGVPASNDADLGTVRLRVYGI